MNANEASKKIIKAVHLSAAQSAMARLEAENARLKADKAKLVEGLKRIDENNVPFSGSFDHWLAETIARLLKEVG